MFDLNYFFVVADIYINVDVDADIYADVDVDGDDYVHADVDDVKDICY